MVTCSLDTLKKSWRRKDMRIKREKSRCYNKLYTVEKRQESKSLLCVTNRYIKVTSKLILPSVSKLKFCPYYKSRVKLIFI